MNNCNVKLVLDNIYQVYNILKFSNQKKKQDWGWEFVIATIQDPYSAFTIENIKKMIVGTVAKKSR